MKTRNKGNIIKGFITTILALTLSLAFSIMAFATDIETGTTIFVNTSDVNVRDSAGTSGNKVAVLQADTALTVLGSATDGDGKVWYNVSFVYNGEDTVGYIRYDFVTTTAPAGYVAPETDTPVEETPVDDGNTVSDAGSAGQIMDFAIGDMGTIIPTEGDGEPEVLPEGFRSLIMRGNGQEIPAWTNDQYYIFYATTSNGGEGWYIFDPSDGGFIRYSNFMAGSNSVATGNTESVSSNGSGVSMTVVVVLSVIIVILVVASTIMGIKLLNNSGSSDDDEDGDDEDDDEEEAPKRKSLFGRRRSYDEDDDDEDDDEDEDDDDDDEDDEPVRKPSQRQNPQMSRQAVRPNGQVVRNANGQVVRSGGQVVRNANGQVVRTNGQVVRNANGQIVRTNGQVVRNANGQVVRTQQRVQRQRPLDEDDE